MILALLSFIYLHSNTSPECDSMVVLGSAAVTVNTTMITLLANKGIWLKSLILR